MAPKKEEARNMVVKAVRKGFAGGKIRNPGDKFVFVGEACPSWCVEVGGKGTTTTSKDMKKVTDAAAYIRTLQSIEEVEAFVSGDDRAGVVSAADEAKDRLLAAMS